MFKCCLSTSVQSEPSPLNITSSSMEIIRSTKFLGVHMAKNLFWSLNTSSNTNLQRWRKAYLPSSIPSTFYSCTLNSGISVWYANCTISDYRNYSRLWTAEKIIGASLPSTTDIYTSVVDVPTHALHTLFTSAIKHSEAFKLSQPGCATVSSLYQYKGFRL